MMNKSSIEFVFFGTPQVAVWVLDELEAAGYVPSLVVTNPDKPTGRHMVLTPSPVKKWAQDRNIKTFEPDTLRNDAAVTKLKEKSHQLFIVAAYGKLIPENILEIPEHGTLNVHPSLLPSLRGASPIRSAILNDMRETGVSIMVLDNELDHGPIVTQKVVEIPTENWPLRGSELDELLAREGGKILGEVLPDWMQGKITPTPQVHEQATFCTKITKEMGEIDLNDDPYQNLLKIRAFDGWPGTFFFTEKNGKRMRVKIIDAELNDDGSMKITRVVPEGKKEMSFDDYNRS